MRAMTMTPPPMPLFDLLKFLSLFVGEIHRDPVVRFCHDLMNASAGVVPHLPELDGGLIDNRRYFGDLFWC
jgi:hypothetical protein